MQNFGSFGRLVWSGPWGGLKIDVSSYIWRQSVLTGSLDCNYLLNVENTALIEIEHYAFSLGRGEVGVGE